MRKSRVAKGTGWGVAAKLSASIMYVHTSNPRIFCNLRGSEFLKRPRTLSPSLWQRFILDVAARSFGPHLISRSHPLIATRLEQIAGNIPRNIVRCKQYTVSDSSKLELLLAEKFDFTISLKT
jgi:hypothetical protein